MSSAIGANDMDPLRPSVDVLCKLGSIIVHADELLSPDGHPVDREALQSAMSDPAVKEWLDSMGAMALVPLKRNPR